MREIVLAAAESWLIFIIYSVTCHFEGRYKESSEISS